MDDIFVLFRTEEHLKLFLNYFSSCYENIKFTSEKGTNNKLSFLDIGVLPFEEYENIHIWHVKHCFKTLFVAIWNFSIKRLQNLKEIFEKNGFDNTFFGKCLRNFSNKIYFKTSSAPHSF